MEYKLALELKNAGFPQNTRHDMFFDDTTKEQYISEGGIHVIRVPTTISPTLSELIEACGDDFDDLRRHVDNGVVSWSAREWEMGGRYGEGSTAEEAMAKLYLALHPTDT